MKRIMNPKDTMGKKLLVEKNFQKRLPTFADVAGIESAKVEMRELVSMLRNPDEYRHLGASVPKGCVPCMRHQDSTYAGPFTH